MSADPGDGRSWVEVARLADLPADSGREFAHAGRVYAAFRVGGAAFVLAGRCPHQRARLAEGAVDPARAAVTCPRRGCLRWQFDLATGASTAGLAVACTTVAARVEGGLVLAALPDPGG